MDRKCIFQELKRCLVDEQNLWETPLHQHVHGVNFLNVDRGRPDSPGLSSEYPNFLESRIFTVGALDLVPVAVRSLQLPPLPDASSGHRRALPRRGLPPRAKEGKREAEVQEERGCDAIYSSPAAQQLQKARIMSTSLLESFSWPLWHNFSKNNSELLLKLCQIDPCQHASPHGASKHPLFCRTPAAHICRKTLQRFL
jgi:hypothetical protein